MGLWPLLIDLGGLMFSKVRPRGVVSSLRRGSVVFAAGAVCVAVSPAVAGAVTISDAPGYLAITEGDGQNDSLRVSQEGGRLLVEKLAGPLPAVAGTCRPERVNVVSCAKPRNGWIYAVLGSGDDEFVMNLFASDIGGAIVAGGPGNDRLVGSGAGDVLSGEDGNDILLGRDGNDTLEGGNGDDTLLGEGGNDAIYGHEGVDGMSGGSGQDSFDGGTGGEGTSAVQRDGIAFIGEGRTKGVNVDLGRGKASGEFEQAEPVAGVERVIGTKFDDVLRGSSTKNYIEGWSGRDTVNAYDAPDPSAPLQTDWDFVWVETGLAMVSGWDYLVTGEGYDGYEPWQMTGFSEFQNREGGPPVPGYFGPFDIFVRDGQNVNLFPADRSTDGTELRGFIDCGGQKAYGWWMNVQDASLLTTTNCPGIVS